MRRTILLCLYLCLLAFPASAHKPSDSYLNLSVEGTRVLGQWDIALRDLDYAMGLDGNGDGAITWGELRARETEVTAYAMPRLKVRSEGLECTPRPTGYLVDNHTDGAYAVLRFAADCAKAGVLEVNYNLFFDLDPQHRGLLRFESAGKTRTAIFSPAQTSQRLEPEGGNPFAQFLEFGREGVWHIWIGFDHILFLLTLLLPAVLERRDGQWRMVTEFRPALVNVLKIVTAFTVAHSITLTLATLGVVELSSRWVESAIAVSVILAALNNLYPLITKKLWMIAFAFGLIHGFGFASVLADLDLPRQALLLALVGFNLGVEVGQLAIVCAFFPLAFWLRDSWFYRKAALVGGSVLVAVVGSVWLAERLFDLRVLAF